MTAVDPAPAVMLSLHGPAITAPMTWAILEAEVRRRGYVGRPLADVRTNVVAWDDPARVRNTSWRSVYVGDDLNTWPTKQQQAMSDAVCRLADIDGITPGEMLARLVGRTTVDESAYAGGAEQPRTPTLRRWRTRSNGDPRKTPPMDPPVGARKDK